MPQTELLDEVLADTPEALREQALLRIKKRRDLRTHAVVYLTLNVVLWAIWAVIGSTSGSWYPWPLWVTLGWGVGLAFNAWDVYLRQPITEHEIDEEIRRLQARR